MNYYLLNITGTKLVRGYDQVELLRRRGTKSSNPPSPTKNTSKDTLPNNVVSKDAELDSFTEDSSSHDLGELFMSAQSSLTNLNAEKPLFSDSPQASRKNSFIDDSHTQEKDIRHLILGSVLQLILVNFLKQFMVLVKN